MAVGFSTCMCQAQQRRETARARTGHRREHDGRLVRHRLVRLQLVRLVRHEHGKIFRLPLGVAKRQECREDAGAQHACSGFCAQEEVVCARRPT